jgi:hypothetical protein
MKRSREIDIAPCTTNEDIPEKKYNVVLDKIVKPLEEYKIKQRLLQILQMANISVKACLVCGFYDYSENDGTWISKCKTCGDPICKSCISHVKDFNKFNINIYCCNDCHEYGEDSEDYTYVVGSIVNS